MNRSNIQFNRLIETLLVLAADYNSQIESLPNFVHIPDEIALLFEDCILIAPTLIEAGLIDEGNLISLNILDNKFESFGEKDWTLDGLRTSPKWQEIRDLSKEILEAYNQNLRKPKLDWVTYV